MDLFEHRRAALTAAEAPLADRMRPRVLDEFVGQGHIIGPGRLLRRAIEADQLSSLIFHGPPGTGKTTLARVIAGTTQAHFVALNAVLAGVKDIRAAVDGAQERRALHGRRTILFVDEVHRFNKAQQDALLPWVENGTLTLIGATTENPFFEVNKALVSRSRVFQLRPLTESDLREVARMALSDAGRGFGSRDVDLQADALEHLVNVSGGDARALLNALELAVETTTPGPDGKVAIDLAVAEESIQRRAVLYDKEGDAHYDTISAFIKSVRGSDPDAALYWLARMVYAGEDPRFIFRRMIILAAEDIGLADPRAVGVVMACAQAFDYVGLPEGQFHLSEAALFLATAAKSNSTMAYFDALESVQRERADEVPGALKDANRDAESLGHGQGYLYPHAYRDHWVAQQYLPRELQGRVFYQPSDQGAEAAIREATHRHREAQLAAMAEAERDGAAPGLEGLSYTGERLERERQRWLARSLGRSAGHLAALRERIVGAAAPSRHAVLLDLAAGTGLLTWELARRAPEGGVYALAASQAEADALAALGGGADEIAQPTVLIGGPAELDRLLELRGEGEVRFDAIVGRDVDWGSEDRAEALRRLAARLAPGGRLVLAERMPGAGSRPLDIVAEDGSIEPELLERARAAEARAFAAEPGLARGLADLEAELSGAGLHVERSELVRQELSLALGQGVLDRWLGPEAPLTAQLAAALGPDEMERVQARMAARLGETVAWNLPYGVVLARLADDAKN